MADRLQIGCAIDREDRVVDKMFRAEFREGQLGQRGETVARVAGDSTRSQPR
jgi:hypothetical protein